MKTNYVMTGEKEPEMFVTKNKQRLKQYGNTVYLKNGDEFEIELFNPTTTKILAKIKLNGISIGSGLIIRPGERVFLERYLETAKKFLFETYQINGNNHEALKAIEKNGTVDVEFYKQYQPQINNNTYIYYYNNYTSSPITWDNTITCSTINSNINNDITYTSNSTLSTNTFTTTSLNSSPRKLETGRIEEGSNSNQSFDFDSTTFEFTPFHKINWVILPNSRKEITKDDLVVYCVKCGRRKRDNENYCPKDGNKF